MGAVAAPVKREPVAAPELLVLRCCVTFLARTVEPWPQPIIIDRDGHMKLWSMDLDGRDLRQHTFRTVLALSDASGEVELWRLPANGVGPSEQLTSGGTKLRWEGVPSPDGTWIAHHDKNMHLWLFEIETKQETTIASSTRGHFRDLRWSPDSKWLAYSAPTAAPRGLYPAEQLGLFCRELLL
jgi:Tol biopolymer transport system component